MKAVSDLRQVGFFPPGTPVCSTNKTDRHDIKDRPFKLEGGGGLWFFVSFRNVFSDNTRVRIFFLSRKARIFFPEFNIGLYGKNSESDYFFSSTKIRIFFSATLGIRIFKKKQKKPS